MASLRGLVPRAVLRGNLRAVGRRGFNATPRILSSASAPQAKLAASGMPFVAPMEKMKASKMFCAQCQQHNKDCGTSVGNCRKTPDVAKKQDQIMQSMKELGYYAHAMNSQGKEVPNEVNRFMLLATFSTLTNVNNDPKRFDEMLAKARTMIQSLKAQAGEVTDPVVPPASIIEQRQMSPDANAASLCEMLTYGLKGVAAYADHAAMLNKEDPRIYAFLHEAYAFLVSEERHDLGKALDMCLKCGEANLWTMDLLYQGNTQFGKQEPTEVKVAPRQGKCVLVSGHDLAVMEALLEACEAEGIDVYTHGELLPAHAYPGLKKYNCLAGHFGGAWNRQQQEFKHFPGPVVFTSNCLIEPNKTYKDNIYTFGSVGWPGVKHLGEDLKSVDWKKVTDAAKQAKGFEGEKEFGYEAESGLGQPSPKKNLMVGFGHDAVLGVADTVLGGVSAGAISRFYLIGGCDGDAGMRNYYTELAEKVPDSSVILTLGCGKFRISDHARERLGNVGDTGIPRVLDVGQCNDTYSAVRIAMGLADALKCNINDLPLSIVLSWYEQKAIAVLLTCLHLGIRPIRVGPTLPAFVTEDVLNVLVKDFGVLPTGDVEGDIKQMHV